MAAVSLSGLDLSSIDWSWEPPKPKKKKRERNLRSDVASAPYLMGDIKPFRSPIDGAVISSRSQLRAHEQKHGVKQCGDYKPGEIIKRENKRIALTREQAKGATTTWE
jgi:hypothetical protein